jgi:hypothetical protein
MTRSMRGRGSAGTTSTSRIDEDGVGARAGSELSTRSSGRGVHKLSRAIETGRFAGKIE